MILIKKKELLNKEQLLIYIITYLKKNNRSYTYGHKIKAKIIEFAFFYKTH